MSKVYVCPICKGMYTTIDAFQKCVNSCAEKEKIDERNKQAALAAKLKEEAIAAEKANLSNTISKAEKLIRTRYEAVKEAVNEYNKACETYSKKFGDEMTYCTTTCSFATKQEADVLSGLESLIAAIGEPKSVARKVFVSPRGRTSTDKSLSELINDQFGF